MRAEGRARTGGSGCLDRPTLGKCERNTAPPADPGGRLKVAPVLMFYASAVTGGGHGPAKLSQIGLAGNGGGNEH